MAHAAVVSLQQKLHEMLVDENFWFVMLDKNFRFLREVVSFWHAFLEDSLSKRNAPEAVEHLESRVKYLGTQLLDRINLYELEKRSPDFNPLNSKVFPDYIVTAASDSIKEYLMKVMNGPNGIDALTTWNPVESDSECTPHLQDTVLDLDNDLLTIKYRLIGPPSKLDVVSIIGMGGIGKTTLARQVYDDIYMEHHFYIRAWITVSQMHQRREMLLGILWYFSLVNDNTYRKSTEQLAEQVYRSLKERRYLIAMDDMWDTNAWDDMKRSFPDDKNGSRVFGRETCPPELEKATMQVVEKCEGLPLAIVVVAGFCSKISKMRSRWEDVAHKIGQVVSRDTEECLNLLVLSYNHLPQRLKPCFLYMGAFPKNFEISVSRLIKLWIAAEFVKCTPEKDFEEVAERYIRDLIDRSLIMVKKRTSGGKVKTCEVHDLLHDLIIRESRKDRSIHFTKSNVIVSPSAASFEYNKIFNFHKASLTHLWHVYDKHSLPRASSFLCFGRDGTPGSCYQIDPFISFTNFVFSTVLDMCFQPFDHLPSEIWKLYSLRYLALASFDVLPPSVRYLSCLQTLIRYSQQSIICLPAAIWNIRKLRHLYFRKCCYFCDELEDYVVWLSSFDLALTKLQTLSYITFGSVTKSVVEGIPNLKKLGIRERKEDCLTAEQMSGNLRKLVPMKHLETLKCFFINPWILQQCDVFSPTLKKLTLRGCQLPWSQMKILCKLPKLEVLKLKYYAFRGSEWEPTDEHFQQLKFLLLDGTDLIHWKASSIQFPSLRVLF
ncbi:putative late blight resistance protein R1B-14 isoform X2 [Capsicum chacoense]